MKKAISIILAVLMLMSAASLAFAAEDAATTVYVSISNKGTLVLTARPIACKDIDGDKKITINDALYCAHEEYFKGGAKAGYESGPLAGYDGISLFKLWGETNSGSFGYYVNDKSAWSLADEVKNGDYVYAFTYSDLTAWSDSYTYFDKKNVDTVPFEKNELTLTISSYDDNWNPVTAPLKDATIFIDGEETEIVTDKDGKAVITINAFGEHRISAKAAGGKVIVPPVCVVNVKFDIVKIITILFNELVETIKGLFS